MWNLLHVVNCAAESFIYGEHEESNFEIACKGKFRHLIWQGGWRYWHGALKIFRHPKGGSENLYTSKPIGRGGLLKIRTTSEGGC